MILFPWIYEYQGRIQGVQQAQLHPQDESRVHYFLNLRSAR